MTRIQKKCFVASAGFHGLLVVVLIFGPGFLAPRSTQPNRPPLDFVPDRTIDQILAGGGSPRAHSSPPAPPPQPQAQPQAQPLLPQPVKQPEVRQRQPDPPKREVRESDPVPPKSARKLPDVSLTRINRPRNPSTSAEKSSRPPSHKSRENERANQLAQAADEALRNIRPGLSAGTEIQTPDGPGGGGPSYANFNDALRKIYTDAWIVPDGVENEAATAVGSVTIARDGTVKEAHLVKGSGDSVVDRSVEMVLRRVTFAVPLPEGNRDPQRTVLINFNVKVKRGLG